MESRDRRGSRPAAPVGPGTLAIWPGYGAGNPRLFASEQFASLLKFNLLKLKGCSLKYH